MSSLNLLENDNVQIHRIQDLLHAIGEDPEREGLRRTPARFLRALSFLTEGYQKSVEHILQGALFDAPSQDLVVVRGIEFYSLCEHHVVPFFGKCHVAYLPDRKIVGLSKIPRVVNAFARRLQVQERLTHQIADSLMEYVKPLGVGVIIEAQHLCMMMRGVEKQNASTLTSCLRGEFKSNPETRAECMKLLGL